MNSKIQSGSFNGCGHGRWGADTVAVLRSALGAGKALWDGARRRHRLDASTHFSGIQTFVRSCLK